MAKKTKLRCNFLISQRTKNLLEKASGWDSKKRIRYNGHPSMGEIVDMLVERELGDKLSRLKNERQEMIEKIKMLNDDIHKLECIEDENQ